MFMCAEYSLMLPAMHNSQFRMSASGDVVGAPGRPSVWTATQSGLANCRRGRDLGSVARWQEFRLCRSGSGSVQRLKAENGCVARRSSSIHLQLEMRVPKQSRKHYIHLSVRASAGRDGIVPAETAAAALRILLESPGIFQGPACHDALSARLVEMAGFSFSFMSGFAVSTVRLAAPDAGLISYGEMVEQGRQITAAVKIPVIGDADTGYGSALNVKRTVKGYIQAGFAGLLLEDQVSPKACGHTRGRRVVSRDEALMTIRAAVDARNESGSDIVIVARTDARQAVSLEEALWRVQAFADAGADVLFVDALASQAEMRAFCRVAPRVPKMANMLEGGGKTPILSPMELEDIGFKIVAYPLSLVGVSIRAMQDALAALKSGRLPPPGDLPSFESLQEIVGFPQYYAEEQRYATDSIATPSYERSLVNARVSSRKSVTGLNDEVQVVVPDVVLEGGESVKAGEPQLRGGIEEASSKVAEVVQTLSPRSMRNSFAGMWARTLRVKITGRDGTVKLDVSIPAGFLEGISNTIPAVAGLDLQVILEKAEINLLGKLESGMVLADFNDPAGDRIQVILE